MSVGGLHADLGMRASLWECGGGGSVNVCVLVFNFTAECAVGIFMLSVGPTNLAMFPRVDPIAVISS